MLGSGLFNYAINKYKYLYAILVLKRLSGIRFPNCPRVKFIILTVNPSIQPVTMDPNSDYMRNRFPQTSTRIQEEPKDYPTTPGLPKKSQFPIWVPFSSKKPRNVYVEMIREFTGVAVLICGFIFVFFSLLSMIPEDVQSRSIMSRPKSSIRHRP